MKSPQSLSESPSRSLDLSAFESLHSIEGIHTAYDQGRVTPVQLVQSHLERAEASSTGAFLSVLKERALAQAEQAEQRLKATGRVPREEQPLFGIPVGIKDNLTLEGARTTCGSRLLENYIPPYTATCVKRLEAAGAISVGKLNLDEFAMGGSNENSAFFPVRHPSHPDRVPGGSSGGSAAAVGAGLCTVSLGSDTGGSIRLPASYCGVVGVKPSYGRVSRFGLVAFASSLDQVGPLSHSLEDSARVLDVISGYDPLDATCLNLPPTRCLEALRQPLDLKKIRVGIPKEYFIGGLAPDVERAVQKSLDLLKAQGAELVPLSLPHTPYAVAVYYLVAVSEASSNLARFDGVRFGNRPPQAAQAESLDAFYETIRSQFGSEVKRRILLGTFALSSGHSDAYYRRACQVRRLTQQDFLQAFEKVDVIAGPVAPTTAFKLGEKNQDPLQMYLNDIFTIPANLVGLPSLSLPCGTDSEGLPIGFHFMAPALQEHRLMGVAHALERALQGA